MVAASVLPAPAEAQDISEQLDIPRGRGATCVADPDFMRINHMELMTHDRDETVLLGDREIKYSLKECVACHAVNGPDSRPVTYKSEKHFCRVCHDFVAVKVDCFQCHNSIPEINSSIPKIDVQGALLRATPNMTEIAAFLEGVKE